LKHGVNQRTGKQSKLHQLIQVTDKGEPYVY